MQRIVQVDGSLRSALEALWLAGATRSQ